MGLHAGVLDRTAQAGTGGDRHRVLHLCSSRGVVYGATLSMMTLVQAQLRRGDEAWVGSFRGRGLGAEVKKLGLPHCEFAVRAKIDPFAVAAIARWLRRQRVDVIHTHLSTSSTNGCLAGRLARVPAVATVHGLSSRNSFLFADRLIAVSSAVRDHLTQQGWPASRIDVVYNGVEPVAGLTRDSARALLGLPSTATVLGTVARLTPLKGVHVAIRALAELPGRPLLAVFGDGEQRSQLELLARELGVESQMRFLGYRPDVRALLPALDLFLFPTLREAMGIAVVEAMLAGLPIVASQVGGVPEVLADNAGLLVPPDDPEALTHTIRKLLDDPAARDQLAARALEQATAKFTAEAMAHDTARVYQGMVRRPALAR